MAQKQDRFAHVGVKPHQVASTTPVAEELSPTPAPTTGVPTDPAQLKMLEQFDVPYEDTVQLNVNVSPALRKAIRLKALQQGVPVTVALRQVLQAWVDNG